MGEARALNICDLRLIVIHDELSVLFIAKSDHNTVFIAELHHFSDDLLHRGVRLCAHQALESLFDVDDLDGVLSGELEFVIAPFDAALDVFSQPFHHDCLQL